MLWIAVACDVRNLRLRCIFGVIFFISEKKFAYGENYSILLFCCMMIMTNIPKMQNIL